MINKKRPFAVICYAIMAAFLMGNTDLSAAASGPQEQASNKADKKETDEKVKKKEKEKEKEKEEALYYEVTVTATRTKRDTFETPNPVSVINRENIEEKAANNVTELLVDVPGLDVNGIGANQSRPVIRGVRGTRILLMEDGIRMNNSRVSQDFGEIPALVDIAEVDRVEVVRGPASVLYGSDAIGGVVNIITRLPEFDPEKSEIHGNLGYRYSSADNQNKGTINLDGNIGRLGIMLGGNLRKVNEYSAPAGTFGDIRLTDDTIVNDTGVKDHGFNLQLTYQLAKNHQLAFKYEYYNAKDGGFGYVDPEAYGASPVLFRILYPLQKYGKYTLRYENNDLKFVLADRFSFTGYYAKNDRNVEQSLSLSLGFADYAWAQQTSENIGTTGFRLELSKAVKKQLFTYGVDFYRDNSINTAYEVETMDFGGGPMPISESTIPNVPNAIYRSYGFFIQDEITLFSRTVLILGGRYQNVNANTKSTPGLESEPLVDDTDQTLVGAANLLVGVTDNLRLVFSVGRGFRSPNLVDRFYNGLASGAIVESNPDLKAETSLNLEAGFKFRTRTIFLEASYFNNTIHDGINRIFIGTDEVLDLDRYKSVNISKLRMYGVEVQGRVFFDFGLSLGANYTRIKAKDLSDPLDVFVLANTYSSKFNFNARYDHPKKFFWAEYDLRINGNQKDAESEGNPVGSFIPGFTVHSLSAGITLFKNSRYPQKVGIIITNLTNELYAEMSNALFFRPAPKRQIILTWSTRF
jgi:hemoglobin/transferrin/lactoferrin receptor protein